MLLPLAGIAVSFIAASSSHSDRPPPWVAHAGSLDGYFLIMAPAELVTGRHGGSGSGNPGQPDSPSWRQIQLLNAQYGVVDVSPMHRTPPRGWRDPALIEALGIDRMWIFELSIPRTDLDEIVAVYAAVPGIERAWRDYRVEGANTPNDTLWSSQWNLHKSHVDCETAWDAATNETVLVSVIDSGADLTHKDLVDNLYANPGEIAGNQKDDDNNGYVDDVYGWDFWFGDDDPTDDNGHGTHVAGIVGAKGNNSRDVTGICWSAKIQAVKVLDQAAGGTWTSIAQGVVYAADNGARVANMSLGGNGGDPGLQAAVDYSAGLDVVQVAAAGNFGNTTPYYPAAYDGVIAVMASDPNDKRPGWSNYGDWCDLVAPGDGVYSLWKNGLTNIVSGTSQASPHVAGVAALMRTLNPQLDRVDVELAIETGCDDLGAPGKDSTYQWGRLNARDAIGRAALLTLEKTTIPTGGSTELWIADGAHPGDLYLIEPSLSGREAGYTLDLFFTDDVRTVPLDRDWLTDFAYSAPKVGIFVDFVSALDGTGQATAELHLPRGNGLSGQTMYFCGFTADPLDLSRARMVTNSVGLKIQ